MIAAEVKYKKTGNEWVPEIPEHWEILKAKNIGYFEGSTVDKKIVKHDKLVRIVNFLDIYANDTFEITEDIDFMRVSATEHQIKNLKVNVGDVVFTPSSEVREDIGKSAVVKYSASDLLFSYHVSRLKFTREIDINFKKYLFNNKPALKYFSKSCKGSTRKILNRIDFKNLPIYLPPIDEQEIIAKNLDTQSNQITHFIQTKQRFIELLKEQRQSIITNAVTKGIDDGVKMKETGIQWIGKVPEHWKVIRIKNCCEVLRGKFTHRPRNDERLYGGKYPFIQTGDIANATMFIETYSQTLNDWGYSVSKEFPKGTLCMTIAANIADVAILNFNACFPDSIVGFKPKGDAQIDFLFFLFSSMKQYFYSIATISTQFNLNIDRVSPSPIAIPTIEEQKRIVEHIKTETRTLDIAISKAEREIELIKEYREAMIAEAVTGKMKL